MLSGNLCHLNGGFCCGSYARAKEYRARSSYWDWIMNDNGKITKKRHGGK